MHFKLNYTNNDFIIITPPSASKARLIELYNNEFRQAIGEENIWPIDEKKELKLFSKYQKYYRIIADFFPFILEHLIFLDRHYFFICTEPVLSGNAYHRGLSYLESCLGYSYATPETSGNDIFTTTGDRYLDIITITLLNFKVSGLEENYSILELSKMNKYASDSSKEAEESVSKKSGGYSVSTPHISEEKLDETFLKQEENIVAQLNDLGILPPS